MRRMDATMQCTLLTEAVPAGITVVSWQAHGGEPVLGSFWAACCGADVAITASLHGGLRLWSVARLLKAATKLSCSQVAPTAKASAYQKGAPPASAPRAMRSCKFSRLRRVNHGVLQISCSCRS